MLKGITLYIFIYGIATIFSFLFLLPISYLFTFTLDNVGWWRKNAKRINKPANMHICTHAYYLYTQVYSDHNNIKLLLYFLIFWVMLFYTIANNLHLSCVEMLLIAIAYICKYKCMLVCMYIYTTIVYLFNAHNCCNYCLIAEMKLPG